MMKIKLTKATVWLTFACVSLAIATVFIWGDKWLEFAVAASFASIAYGIANNERIQELQERLDKMESQNKEVEEE